MGPLFDTRFRTFATPGLITWIYRGCLATIMLVTAVWMVVAAWVMSWRNGWFWGLVLLVCAPLAGILVTLCVRVLLEFAVVRFPAESPSLPLSPASPSSGDVGDHDPAASRTHGVAPLVSGAVDTARSVIQTLRTQPQGGRPVHPDRQDDEPTTAPADAAGPADSVLPVPGGGQADDFGGGGEGPHGPPGMRSIWMAAGAVGVVLVLALALALIVGSGGGDDKKHKSAASAPATAPSAPVTVTVTAPASGPPSSAPGFPAASPVPSGSAPAGPGAATPTWTGSLTIVGPAADRDLDAVPPRSVEGGTGAGDIRADWLEPVLHSTGSATLAQLEAGAASGPSQCAAAVASSSTNATETLHDGDVVCVDTGRGHLARLVVTRATQSSTAPTLSFKVTVWPAPGAGQ